MSTPAPKHLGKVSTVAVLAVATFIATHGEKLAASATVFWKWLLMVFNEMPASWASLLAGWCFGLAVMYALRRWIPDPGHHSRWNNTRMAVIELASGAAAFSVVALQISDDEGAFIPLVFALIIALTVSVSYRIAGAGVELILRRAQPTRGADHEEVLQQAGPQGQDPARPADG